MNSKRKSPWLPNKPINSLKCKTCYGTGKKEYLVDFYKTKQFSCNDCGGKGFK
jgi:DnaJ-class molecular chaperone